MSKSKSKTRRHGIKDMNKNLEHIVTAIVILLVLLPIALWVNLKMQRFIINYHKQDIIKIIKEAANDE